MNKTSAFLSNKYSPSGRKTSKVSIINKIKRNTESCGAPK